MNKHENIATAIDLNEANRFLKVIDSTEINFDFRTFDDNVKRNDKNLVRCFYGPLAKYADELKYLNDRGAGVFVTVNKTDGVGRKAESIIECRAVFADLDGAPLEPVLQNPVKPHIIVESSPGRFHPYWLVEDMPLAEFSSVQKALLKRFDGDTSVHDLPRVMRLPGFYHRKAEPFLVRILSTNDIPPHPAANFKRAPEEPHISDGEAQAPIEKIEAAMACILNAPGTVWEITDYRNGEVKTYKGWHGWNRIMMALYRATGGSAAGYEIALKWSALNTTKYSKSDVKDTWYYRYVKSPPTQLGARTLFTLANTESPQWEAVYDEEHRDDNKLLINKNIILAAAALENLPPPTDWKYCLHIGLAAHRATNGAVEGFRAWYRWAKRSPLLVSCKYIYRSLGDYGQAENEWLNYFKSPPNQIGLATLLDLANQADPNWRDKLSEEFWQRVVSS